MTSRKLLSVLVSMLATALAAGCGDDPSDPEDPVPSFEGWYRIVNAKKDSVGLADVQRLAISFEMGDCRASGSWSAETKDSTFSATFKTLEGCGKTLSGENVWDWSFSGDTLSLSADGKLVWRLVPLDSLPEPPDPCRFPEDASSATALTAGKRIDRTLEAGSCDWFSATASDSADQLQWLDGHLLSTDVYARIRLATFSASGEQLDSIAGTEQSATLPHSETLIRVSGVDAAQAGKYRIGYFPKAEEGNSSEELSSSAEQSSSSAAARFIEVELDSLYDEVVLTETDTVWFKLSSKKDKKYTITCLDAYSAKVVGLYGSDVILDVLGSDKTSVIAKDLDFAGVSTAEFTATGSTTWIAVRMNFLNGFFGLMVTD